MRRLLATSLGLLAITATGCQFDNPCGDDDLVYDRGLCFPPPAPEAGPAEDSGAEMDAPMSVPDERCDDSCALIGRCVASNEAAADVLASELATLGFDGTDASGCVENCYTNHAGSDDDDALDCFVEAEQTADCGAPGLLGALPAVTAVNTCCEGRTDSEFCTLLCELLTGNETVGSQFTACTAF